MKRAILAIAMLTVTVSASFADLRMEIAGRNPDGNVRKMTVSLKDGMVKVSSSRTATLVRDNFVFLMDVTDKSYMKIAFSSFTNGHIPRPQMNGGNGPSGQGMGPGGPGGGSRGQDMSSGGPGGGPGMDGRNGSGGGEMRQGNPPEGGRDGQERRETPTGFMSWPVDFYSSAAFTATGAGMKIAGYACDEYKVVYNGQTAYLYYSADNALKTALSSEANSVALLAPVVHCWFGATQYGTLLGVKESGKMTMEVKSIKTGPVPGGEFSLEGYTQKLTDDR